MCVCHLGGNQSSLPHEKRNGWTIIDVPSDAPDRLVSVIEVKLAGSPDVSTSFGLDPNGETEIRAEFSKVTGAKISKDRWMEKFGEWVCEYPATKWQAGGKAVWEVDVLVPGDYQVALTYTGKGRLVWGVDVGGGEHIQNQQNASHNYQRFPLAGSIFRHLESTKSPFRAWTEISKMQN